MNDISSRSTEETGSPPGRVTGAWNALQTGGSLMMIKDDGKAGSSHQVRQEYFLRTFRMHSVQPVL